MSETQVHTILIAEDDPHTRELLEFNLEEAGYRVFAAESANAALGMLATVAVDVIISDVMMPGLTGFDFRECVRENSDWRDIAFIFLTARSTAEDQIRGLESGADEYITKPFDVEILLARIHAVLARRAHFAQKVSTDHLTNLLNRQAVESAVTRELKRIRRYPTSASLVYLDLDDFKSINDTHGHAAGDDALVAMSKILKQMTRQVDVVGRMGGEEFIVFFPQTREHVAEGIVLRMQDAMRAIKISDSTRTLSFSAGIVEAPRDGDSFAQLSARSDAAMFAAKRTGKDRIVCWRPALEEEDRSREDSP